MVPFSETFHATGAALLWKIKFPVFLKCRVDLALETGEKLLPVSDKSVRILCDSLMQCIELTCSGQHWDGKK